MTIIEYFDPVNIKHCWAYKHLQLKGSWLKDFLPKDLTPPPATWAMKILAKLADEYLRNKLSESPQQEETP